MAGRALTAATLAGFGMILRDRRDEAEQHLADLRADLDEARAARADGTSDDEHDPEGPTMSQAWSQLTGLVIDAEAEIIAIDAALARLDAGVYGICLRCGRQIARPRLEARPTAERCIECARLAG